MNSIPPEWVAVLMAFMTGVGALIPKMKEFLTQKKKEDQEGVAFLLVSYKDTILLQDQKLQKLESRLVDVQQKVVDIQTANVATLMENMKMREQIQTLTTENATLRHDLDSSNCDRETLRLKVEDLERRMQK